MTDEAADDWDFYPCLVDDKPASIFLNLRYEDDRPAADTLYWIGIRMLDVAEHGMGSGAEAEALYPLEDALTTAATERGLVYVGRLRTDGEWRLVFYGTAGQREALDAIARAAKLGRTFEIGSERDREWAHYREFLLPDPERQQWMKDRRLVEVLEQHGDPLVTPRRVDHWAHFPSARARQAFVRAAAKEGFALETERKEGRGADAFGAQVFRTDPVELDDIHDVVMTLVDLAEEHGGSYNGWETSVEKAQ